MFRRGYFIENDLRDSVLPSIIIIVFFFRFGCATRNKALEIIKLVSIFIFLKQRIYKSNQIDNFEHYW